MKKILVMAMAALLLSGVAKAQTPERDMQISQSTTFPRVTRVEGELFGGIGSGIGSYRGTTPCGPAWSLGTELRVNLASVPVDVGGYLRMDHARWEMSNGFFKIKGTNSSYGIGGVAHYNFRQGRKVNPYVGAALGYCHMVDECDKVSNGVEFVPKVGVEFLYFLRIGAYAHISHAGFNTCGVSLGFTIGGWRSRD